MNPSSREPVISLRACAKLNLHLRVLRKQPDGYHDLVSWMQRIDWYDELELWPGSNDGIEWHCDDTRLGPTHDNLVIRAAHEFAVRTGNSLRVAIRLTKRLPLGGGLGGGSSDAAAMIVSLARLWGMDTVDPRLREAAEAVGSDVPFFLGPAAIARGRGTELSPHPRPFDGCAVLILPPFGTSTPQVYAACRPAPLVADEIMPWESPWRDAAELSSRLKNDLLAAACAVEPRLGKLHTALDGRDGVRVHLSGSGSTMYALFDDESACECWKSRVNESGVEVRVVRVLAT